MKAAQRLVLFDVDGTLLSTHAGSRSMQRAGRKIWGPRFSLDGITFAGSLDSRILQDVARNVGFVIKKEAEAAFKQIFLEELEADLADPRTELSVMPGVFALLAELRSQSRVALGLLTGNYRSTGHAKLRAAAIDPEWFALTAWGDEAPTRGALVRSALRRRPDCLAEETIVVGDTPRDIECAHENGCRVLAVATGRYSTSELHAAGADVVAQDLSDPKVLLRMLG